MSLVPRLPSAGHTAASILSRASSLVPRSAFSAICESASAATATGTAGRGIPSFTASSFVSPGTSAVPPASSSLQSAWSPATSAAPGTSAILTAISHLQSSQSSPSASAETQSVAETKDQGPFTDEEMREQCNATNEAMDEANILLASWNWSSSLADAVRQAENVFAKGTDVSIGVNPGGRPIQDIWGNKGGSGRYLKRQERKVDTTSGDYNLNSLRTTVEEARRMRDSVGEEFCRTMAQLKRLYDAEPVLKGYYHSSVLWKGALAERCDKLLDTEQSLTQSIRGGQRMIRHEASTKQSHSVLMTPAWEEELGDLEKNQLARQKLAVSTMSMEHSDFGVKILGALEKEYDVQDKLISMRDKEERKRWTREKASTVALAPSPQH